MEDGASLLHAWRLKVKGGLSDLLYLS